MLRVAILESSHWHAPLYLPGLVGEDTEVVAVSDGSDFNGRKVAERVGAKFYASYEQLLDNEQVDVAFAFGQHAEMLQIGTALIERGVPFSLEKPCGINAAEVFALSDLSSRHGVYAAVPLIFRVSDLFNALRRLDPSHSASFSHISSRFVAGVLSRYNAAGSPWMLNPAVAGGGCTINLAPHFIDLFRLLTGQEIVSVSAQMNNKLSRASVEEYSLVTLTTADGTVGIIETGYTFPGDSKEQREFSFSLSADQYYARLGDQSIIVRPRDGSDHGARIVPVRFETDDYYPVFVRRVLADVKAGANQPVAGLADAAAVMVVIDAAYASARSGGAPVQIEKIQSRPEWKST